VSDEAYGATVAKSKLSRRLGELRRASGYTANHVCDMLNWGRGKVGRFEANQWKRPEMSDVRDLLRLYGVEGAEREELEELAVKARARGWWRDYPDVYDNEFPGFESDAVAIRVFMPLVLPGLMQTREYMEAILRFATKPPFWQRRAVECRLRRQEILDRTDGTEPNLIAVITEASLAYRWGIRTDRRDQILHLIELGRRRNITLRLQRFADGPPQGLFSPVNIFELPDGEPAVAFTETDIAIEQVTGPDDIARYIETFGRACDAALEPADTMAYLRQLADQLE
jgi:hypothetical protein